MVCPIKSISLGLPNQPPLSASQIIFWRLYCILWTWRRLKLTLWFCLSTLVGVATSNYKKMNTFRVFCFHLNLLFIILVQGNTPAPIMCLSLVYFTYFFVTTQKTKVFTCKLCVKHQAKVSVLVLYSGISLKLKLSCSISQLVGNCILWTASSCNCGGSLPNIVID